MEPMMIISTLSLVLGAGFCSGINLYATIAVLGCLHRFADGFTLPPGMEVLGHEGVILAAAFMYTIEFFADKIPAVDSAWDTVHTFIRVPAGAVLAAVALGDVPIEYQMMAGLLGGTLAFGAHTTKATMRLAAHGTGTSPVTSPALSVAEDVAVIGTISLIAANPILSLFVLALLMIASFFVLRACWKFSRRALRYIFGLWKPKDQEPAAAA